MENDKTYMWLAVITFLGLAIGLAVGFTHLQEYKDPTTSSELSSNPFRK